MQRNEQGMRIDVKTDALGPLCPSRGSAQSRRCFEVLDEKRTQTMLGSQGLSV